jgi:hypothetical protein
MDSVRGALETPFLTSTTWQVAVRIEGFGFTLSRYVTVPSPLIVGMALSMPEVFVHPEMLNVLTASSVSPWVMLLAQLACV